ncbi:hypothetical protein D3C86_1450010 [compost metagenome]
MRTWSWKYSRCRTPGTAQQTCACWLGAVWADSGIMWASARAAAFRKPVSPMQRVASACSTSTAPASSMRRKYGGSKPYSPAVMAIPAGARSRSRRSPSRSSDETGSSNHVTRSSAKASAKARASFRA